MSKASIEALKAKQFQGFQFLPDGTVAFLPFVQSAIRPIEGGLLALALRFRALKAGPDDTTLEQIQLGLSPQECRKLAKQLLAAADVMDRELAAAAAAPKQ